MNPTWYDVLDVTPDASTGEIREAWQRAITDLGPTDRRFRVVNQAAEVLLDDERRAAYDAELAPEESEEPGASEPDEDVDPDVDPDVDSDADTGAGPDEAAGVRGRRLIPVWLLVLVGVVTVATVVLAAVLWVVVPSDSEVADATSNAQAAAEEAIVPVLSYDASDMAGSKESAHSFMTGDYQEESYDPLFEVLQQNADETGTVVEVEVVASGIVRAGEDRVRVLLLVDRPTTNKQQSEPVVYRDHVTATMQNVDGEWLVDGLETAPARE